MNIATFLGNHQISQNPFQAEEARHDSVFIRIETACYHPDFQKILGDFLRPSSAIVFGERGSGKTAIRLQIEQRLSEHNRSNEHATQRCLPLIYDEHNPVLDRFSRSVRKTAPQDVLGEFRLVDHIDAMMSTIVPKIVDQALDEAPGTYGGPGDGGALELGGPNPKRFRQIDAQAKHDLLLMHLHYDRPDSTVLRTRRLKRALRLRSTNPIRGYRWMAAISAAVTLAGIGYFLLKQPSNAVWLWWVTLVLLLLFTGVMAGRLGLLWWKTHRLARELSGKLRVLNRPASSIRAALMNVNTRDLFGAGLPRTNDDDMRYAMFGRLLNISRPFGYRSILVLVDRVDEPTLINGEPERMRAFVWPMLNNKFLQQDRIGVKLLLPLDLRHLLNRETSEFFREARLDKQNFIERLTWSGAILYDLCNARLNACRPADASPMTLRDLFAQDVTQQDLIDALDQMQQPRDAFKFIYHLIQEHCSNVPEDQPQWHIPRPVLDHIRKQQVDRMSGMLRGVRPG
ncbi:MAG: hypothetical protein L0Y44_02050 [Phycisphaerales bacterium]|nr:hypothetical protein [Phycisphaerales bacterium]MCI0629420.1 hypothetical protein [Phycisphaerales bacterium]MCI0675565.1 hypothetical protein [Phycisphaerales bacterium]